MASAALAILLAWALFAFGAVYPWASWPVVIGSGVVFLAVRPPLFQRDTRALDLALLLVLLAAAFQLVPIPPHLHAFLSPGSADFHARTDLLAVAANAWRPISLEPGATRLAYSLLAAAVLLYVTSRHAAREHGIRTLARAIAWMGFVASVIALVQPAVFPSHKIYGFWQPEATSAHPVGPIVSRNHFAAWMVLALPLTAGYLVTHARTHWFHRSVRPISAALGDTRAFWLLAASLFMAAGLVITESRSGILGFSVALLFGLVWSWRGMRAAGRAGVIAYVATMAAAVFLWANPEMAAGRFNQTLSDSWGGRPEIWRETGHLIARFWQTGIGLGTFDVVMAVYQTATRAVFFNHAHNQYLHTFTEGGLLVGVPVAIAIACFLRLAWRRLRQDHTPLRFLRAGALAGILGLMAQCVWEVPLLTPAVFFLLAVVCGIATHAPRSTREGAR